jgi:helix-turn-helix protein
MSPAGQGDNNATFLAEFRALRDHAGLDYTELAARAHYPSDVLKKAEAGPGLPGLPILAAYVRACDADVTEWEERWRRLAVDADLGTPVADADEADCGLPVRPAGASPAAKAGARVTVAPADVHDPERIKAALRAHRAREEASPDNGVAHGNGLASGNGNGNGATSSWASDNGPVAGTDAVNGSTTMLANGHHHRRHGAQTSASHGSATSFASGSPSASAAFWSSVTSEAESASTSADPSASVAPPSSVAPPVEPPSSFALPAAPAEAAAVTEPDAPSAYATSAGSVTSPDSAVPFDSAVSFEPAGPFESTATFGSTPAEPVEPAHSPATESTWKAPDFTVGHPSPNGRSYATSSNEYSPSPYDTRSTAGARPGHTSGKGQFKLVALVLVVLIGCVLLITLV